MHPNVSDTTLELLATLRGLSEFANTEDPPAAEEIFQNDMQLALEGIVEKRNRTVEDLERVRTELGQKEDRLRQATIDLNNVSAERDKAKQQRNAAQKEFHQTKESAEKAEADRERAASEYERIQLELGQATARLAETKTHLNQITNDRRNAITERDRIQEQRNAAQKELQQTEEVIEQAASKYKQSHLNLEQTETQLAETKNYLGQVTIALNNVSAERDKAKQQRDAAQKEFQQTKDALEQAKVNRETASRDLEEIRKELQQTKQQKAQVQEEFASVDKETKEMRIQASYWQSKEKSVMQRLHHLIRHRFALGLVTTILIMYIGVLWWQPSGMWLLPVPLFNSVDSSAVPSALLQDQAAELETLHTEIATLKQTSLNRETDLADAHSRLQTLQQDLQQARKRLQEVESLARSEAVDTVPPPELISDESSALLLAQPVELEALHTEIATLKQTLLNREADLTDAHSRLQTLQQDLQQTRESLQQVVSLTQSETVNTVSTPEPNSGALARVNPDNTVHANLRQGPSTQSTVSATVAPGTQVIVKACATGPDGDGRWFQMDSDLWIWGELLVDIQESLFENCS